MRTMRPLFRERLQEASEYAGVEFSATAIGRALGVPKQTVHVWMTNGEPRPAMLFHISDTWQVDARWLATGDGSMVPPPSSGTGLSTDEIEMIKRYRRATPKNRPSIIAVAKSLAKVAGLAALVVSAFAFNKNSFAGNSEPQSLNNLTVIHIVHFWQKCKEFVRRIFAPRTADEVITA